jgi:hypothetical protein
MSCHSPVLFFVAIKSNCSIFLPFDWYTFICLETTLAQDFFTFLVLFYRFAIYLKFWSLFVVHSDYREWVEKKVQIILFEFHKISSDATNYAIITALFILSELILEKKNTSWPLVWLISGKSSRLSKSIDLIWANYRILGYFLLALQNTIKSKSDSTRI